MSSPIPYNVVTGTQFPASPVVVPKTYNQRFNQIVRLAVQLSGTPFGSQSDLLNKANWDALLAATDSTRIILSPLFSNTKITTSKILETGADTNATYRGEPIYFGEGVGMFTGEFQDCDAAAIDTFFSVVSAFSMSNAVGSSPLVAYWCNNDGHIFSTPIWGGLPMINFTVRTRGSDGLNSSDKIPFNFYLPPNWDGGDSTPTPSIGGVAGTVDLRTYP